MNEGFSIVAIDGGAASGKSSTARGVAEAVHFLHVDTGAHYRAVTLRALHADLEPRERPELESFLQNLVFETIVKEHSGLIRLNGEVPAQAAIRSDAVNASVSAFAALPSVRAAVCAYQRGQADVARNAGFRGLVMDGRDIGTVIFPDADLKVFLFADAATRAARRLGEGQLDTIADRDHLDSTRATAPLVPAADAVQIDNSSMPLKAVIAEVLRLLGEKTGVRPPPNLP